MRHFPLELPELAPKVIFDLTPLQLRTPDSAIVGITTIHHH